MEDFFDDNEFGVAVQKRYNRIMKRLYRDFWIYALFAVALGLLIVTHILPASAHHSFAMFDNSKIETVEGTVVGWEWINPHVWLHVDDWSFEAGSPNQLLRAGWAKDEVTIGEKIKVQFHPLKDGSNGGQLRYVIHDNGKIVCQGNACEEERS